MASKAMPVQTYLEGEVYEAFARLADMNERSLAAQLRMAVKEQLMRENGKAAA